MDTVAHAGDTLVCARCGAPKPVAAFDQRFIGKTLHLTCSECRGIRDERRKWQDSWAQRRVSEAAWKLRWQAMVAEEEARHRMMERARRQEQRKEELLYAYLLGRGFSDADAGRILGVHEDIKSARQPWADIKRQYAALTPPYIPHVPRKRASPATRIAVYAAQEGRCFYCQRTLLPLEVWKRGSRDGRSVIDEMDFSQRHMAADSGIPELDHKIPVSRGGSHEQDNLCFACRKCNQLKGIRTVEEFACYPDDPISQLPMDVGIITEGIALEARGYDLFDVGLPTLKELEKLANANKGAR